MTDANGLYHMRARYYSPDIKRFINRDVVTGTISDTPTLNRYAYVNGNPISYIDPFGLSRDGDSLMLRGGDMLLDLVPGVGALKGFQQAFTGVNLVTGEKLSVGQRWMEGIGSAIGLIPIPGSKAIGKYGVEGVVTLGKKAKGWFGKGTGKTEELITVYRGTNNYLENAIYDETGHLLSDATRIAYRESGNLANAYKASQPIHDEWLKIWYNSMDDYVQAHGAFGTDLPKAFRMDRTLMSVTTDEKIAKYFANGGMVYKAKIPKSQLIPQTLPGSTESEYLIKFGIGGFTPK